MVSLKTVGIGLLVGFCSLKPSLVLADGGSAVGRDGTAQGSDNSVRVSGYDSEKDGDPNPGSGTYQYIVGGRADANSGGLSVNDAIADDNKLKLATEKYRLSGNETDRMAGGYARAKQGRDGSASATNNILSVEHDDKSGQVSAGHYSGGLAVGYGGSVNASKNKAYATGSADFAGKPSFFYGGCAETRSNQGGTAEAKENRAEVSSALALKVVGGSASAGLFVKDGGAYNYEDSRAYDASKTWTANTEDNVVVYTVTGSNADMEGRQLIGGESLAETSAKANGNSVTLAGEDTDGVEEIALWGGLAEAGQTAEASGNTIRLALQENTEAAYKVSVHGGLASAADGASAAAAQAFGNKITNEADTEDLKELKDFSGTVEITGDFYAGRAVGKKAEAAGNSLELVLSDGVGIALLDKRESSQGAGTSVLPLAIGIASTGTSDKVQDGTASASENSFVVRDGGGSGSKVTAELKELFIGYAIVDGKGDAKAYENKMAAACTTGQQLALTGKEIAVGRAQAADGSAEACSNELNISAGGGDVVINADSISIGKAQAEKGSATAKDNSAVLDGGVWNAVIYGGTAKAEEGDASASQNLLVLKGGTYNKDLYGGCSEASASGTAKAEGNTIRLTTGTDGAAPQFGENVVLCGALATAGASAGTTSGNTLQVVSAKGMTAGNIRNFEKVEFQMDRLQAGETVLTLTGTDKKEKTNLNGAEVSANITHLTGSSGGEFLAGEKVCLLRNDNGIETETAVLGSTTVLTGISLQYNLAVQADETTVFLTRTSLSVASGTKAVAEGMASGLALANEAANAGLELARNFSPEIGIVAPFMHVQGSSVTHETGSNVHLNTVSLAAGIGTGLGTGAGKMSIGAFFEYGKGSYTTSNSFSDRSDINGDGTSWYMGAGILAKMDFIPTGPGHFYVEGSAHMGQLHNEFDAGDLRDSSGRAAGFDTDSPYYSLHAGAGYVWNLAEGHDLDVYGKYIWTRVQGTDETLTTGDRFEFDDMDSSRVRFGARYTYKGSERFKPYIGVAYEHEFAGSCESTTFGYNVAAPSFEGDTGIGELGLTMTPSETLPLSINLGVQGYVGQKRGVSGNCMVKYEF